MADEFQYVHLPDGSYGKFRGDAPDSLIRDTITKQFPDAFRSQASPISPPGVPRPSSGMHESYLLGDENADPNPPPSPAGSAYSRLKRNFATTGRVLKAPVEDMAAGIARVSAPGIASTLMAGTPEQKKSLPSDVMGAGLGVLAGGMEAPELGYSERAASSAAPETSAAARLVRSTTGGTQGAGAAEGGASGLASDVMDAVMPKTGTRLRAMGRLLKRATNSDAAEAVAKPSETPTPIEVNPQANTAVSRLRIARTDAEADPNVRGTAQFTRSPNAPPPTPAVTRPEPAWKSAQTPGTEVPSTLDREPTTSGPGRTDYRPNVRRGLTDAQKKLAKRPPAASEAPAPKFDAPAAAEEVKGAVNKLKKNDIREQVKTQMRGEGLSITETERQHASWSKKFNKDLDESDRAADVPGTLYHGVPDEALENVRKGGLDASKPGKTSGSAGQGGDWMQEYLDTGYVRDHPPGTVYMTDDPEYAKQYGKNVVKVKVTPELAKRIAPGDEMSPMNEYTYHGKVPPDNLEVPKSGAASKLEREPGGVARRSGKGPGAMLAADADIPPQTPTVRKFKMGETGNVNPHPRKYYPEQEMDDDEVDRVVSAARKLKRR